MVYSYIKKVIKRAPFFPILYKSIRKPVINTVEGSLLSQLAAQNRTVVFKPCLQMNQNEIGRQVLRETVKDFLDHFGNVSVGKTVADRLTISEGSILLYRPLALLRIPLSHDDYLKAVGAKTRNMIRKAQKQGYKFKEFDWNNYLDDIFIINTSKDVRSAGRMHGWYVKPVKPRHHSEEEQRYWKYYGVFQGDRLWAYSNMVLCGDFAFFKYFIGHADHLKNGIMNYLLSCIVQEYVGHSHIEWLNYGYMALDISKQTEMAFKKHAGFEAYATFFDLEKDPELLRYCKATWVGEL